MATSTVVKVAFKNQFEGKFGPQYSWHVTMDNGDAGETVTKTDMPPWEVGNPAEYTLEWKEYNGKSYAKIKKAFEQRAGGNGDGKRQWTPDPEKETRKERWAKQIMIGRQACLNTAASLISAGCGPSTVENLTGLAEQLETWTKRGIDLKTLVAPAPAPQPAAAPPPAPRPTPAPRPQPVATSPDGEDDGLPF